MFLICSKQLHLSQQSLFLEYRPRFQWRELQHRAIGRILLLYRNIWRRWSDDHYLVNQQPDWISNSITNAIWHHIHMRQVCCGAVGILLFSLRSERKHYFDGTLRLEHHLRTQRSELQHGVLRGLLLLRRCGRLSHKYFEKHFQDVFAFTYIDECYSVPDAIRHCVKL